MIFCRLPSRRSRVTVSCQCQMGRSGCGAGADWGVGSVYNLPAAVRLKGVLDVAARSGCCATRGLADTVCGCRWRSPMTSSPSLVRRCPRDFAGYPANRIDNLLPWNWKRERQQAASA
jgi:hypothetical protein